jgi:hypothetical protein
MMPDLKHAWTGFRTVLSPVDFAEHSCLALKHAEAITRRRFWPIRRIGALGDV